MVVFLKVISEFSNSLSKFSETIDFTGIDQYQT